MDLHIGEAPTPESAVATSDPNQEGLATIVVAIAAYWFVQNYPDTAPFLSNKERAYIHARLASDSDATHNEAFTWANVVKALKDPKCWLYGLAFHTTSLPLYTFSLFIVRFPLSPDIVILTTNLLAQPTIINSLGYTAANAQLLTIPPYAFGFVTTISVAVISERSGYRAPFMMGSALFASIGYVILLSNTDPLARPGVSYLGTFFAAGGIYPATALALSWPAINVSGQTKRAVANAMQISIGNCGAVLGTQLYRANDGPRYIVGHSFATGYLLANAAVAATIWFVLKRENERRDAAGLVEVQEIGEVEDWEGDEDGRWRFQY